MKMEWPLMLTLIGVAWTEATASAAEVVWYLGKVGYGGGGFVEKEGW